MNSIARAAVAPTCAGVGGRFVVGPAYVRNLAGQRVSRNQSRPVLMSTRKLRAPPVRAEEHDVLTEYLWALLGRL